MDFSVLMPIDKNEKDEELKTALESVINQTLKPSEILIIADKYIPQNTKDILDEYKIKYPDTFNPVILDKIFNVGTALRYGVELAKNPLVAIMSSKNVASDNRFEKQIKFLADNPNIDVVGSWIAEFDVSPSDIYALREVPTNHEDILKFSKFRNPINHTTVMFKKASVLRAASYTCRKKLSDYALWVSMLYQGCKFANIPECLVYVRAGKDFVIKKTGQNKDFLYEYGLFERFFESGFINFREFFKAIFLRFSFRMLPSKLRFFLYCNFVCKKISGVCA